MESRTVWIIVAVVVIGALLCCCALIVGGAVAGVIGMVPLSREGGVGRVAETTEQVFEVEPAPELVVDNFAGNVVVDADGDGEVRVTVTKRAGNSSQMNDISVDLEGMEDGVRIVASAPSFAGGFRTVDIQVIVPADADLRLETGAGNIEVGGVIGEMDAHTGAGNIEVQGAAGPVSLDTGAGEVDYAGEPRGECIFSTGAGNVTLRLPAELDAQVELHTGIGTIDLGGFDVDGEITNTEVDGVIGSGEDASIEARSGAGNVELDRR